MTTDATRLLGALVGCSLANVKVVVHCYDNSITAAVACNLEFEDANLLSVRNGSDGEALLLAKGHEAPIELGEYGHTKLISPAELGREEILRCIGRPLSRAVLTLRNADLVAVELDFHGEHLRFCNDSDEFVIGRCVQELSRTQLQYVQLP
jgi:hypothetical protein